MRLAYVTQAQVPLGLRYNIIDPMLETQF